MKINKIALIILGLLALICIISATIIQKRFNSNDELSFIVSILLGIFSSGLVTFLFSIVYYLIEKARLIDELSRYYAGAVLSLAFCSRIRKENVQYKLEKYYEWKSNITEFFRVYKQFSPFCRNIGKSLVIEQVFTLLDPFFSDVMGKEYFLKTIEITENDKLNTIFLEIREIMLKYKDQINEYLDKLIPGTKVDIV